MPHARGLADIERQLDDLDLDRPREEAMRLLGLAEKVLEAWVCARGSTPTQERREGSRLMALHRQGSDGAPGLADAGRNLKGPSSAPARLHRKLAAREKRGVWPGPPRVSL